MIETDEELARLDAEMAGLEGREDLSSRALLARAAIEKGKRLADDLERPAEAVAAFDVALSASIGEAALAPKACVVDALFFRSQALFDLDRPDDALASVADLVARFGEETEPTLRFGVCHALYVTAWTLGREKPARDDAVVSLCGDLIARYGSDADRLVRDRVRHTMIEKSFALDRLGRRDEGVALRNALVLRHLNEKDQDVRAHAARIAAAMDQRFAIADAEKHEAGGVRHYCGRWPDDAVPAGEADWAFYEVDVAGDAILRDVHLFADGRVERNSLDIEAGNGLAISSLTDRPFLETVYGVPLEPIAARDFEALWEQGVDTPFWSGPLKR